MPEGREAGHRVGGWAVTLAKPYGGIDFDTGKPERRTVGGTGGRMEEEMSRAHMSAMIQVYGH